jgi:hypothetical protein
VKNFTLPLADIAAVDKFRLSFPVKKRAYDNLKKKFSPIPFILVNHSRELIFSLDYFYCLTSSTVDQVEVTQLDTSDEEALFINYNLKEVLTGLNLFEKLVFIHKITPLVKRSDIYQNTNLDININDELIKKLALLISDEFSEVLSKERISLKSALTLCEFLPQDRKYMRDLFLDISFSNSHQQKVLELIEELIFREKHTVSNIFEKLGIHRYIELEKPQKHILHELFKFRYPLYQKHEREWEQKIKNVKMPGHMKLTHSPFFEKRGLQLTIELNSLEELKKIIKIHKE